METTLQVEAAGLLAVTTRLRTAAAELAKPGAVVHPSLAADQTSVTAAGRLSAAATALQSAAESQAAALAATAEHLASIATTFTAQEAVNTAAVQALTSAAKPVGSPSPLGPLPSVAADVRPPLSSPIEVDGEVVARQLFVGSASAGSGFTESWHSRSAAAAAVRDVIHDVLSALPDAWMSPSGAEAATTRLLQHADAVARIGDRAAALADQADSHSRNYRGAVANTPKPADFEAVRNELRQALEANARFPGQYTPLVSSLIAQQGAMQQQALNTQSEYHGQTEANTGPEQAGQLAAALPGMVPGLLGAVGGLVGGALAAAAQLPQTLMETGQQLKQAATQGLSGLATPPASGIDSATKGLGAASPGPGVPGPVKSGATSPAGASETTPVTPSTSPSPPPATTLPQGAQPAAVATSGPSAVPMGMPMGMLAPAAAAQAGTQVSADKKIVVPVTPHTEPVTGRTTPERLTGRRPIEDETS